MNERSDNPMGQFSYEDAHALVSTVGPPTGFKQWGLADSSGWTVAHCAAAYGHLPADFDQWELADERGRTVAHHAAWHGRLPVGFDRWDIADSTGWSIAHEAAKRGHLPADFNLWGMLDSQGVTVLRVVLDCMGRSTGNRAGFSYLEAISKRWDKEKPLCETDADWEVFKQELPEVYYKHAVNEVMSDASCDGISNGAML
jgi:hypothetical protein